MPKSEQPLPPETPLTDEREQIVVRANYELFVLALSALQLANWILFFLLRNDQAERIPFVINMGLSLFFILDACYRFLVSPNRRRFLLYFHGYLIFLGSLPIPFSSLLRILWYRIATRRLRRGDYLQMERVVVRKRAQSAMLGILLAAIIVLEVSSITIVELESRAPDANILTADDALWWAVVTMATVGYGDYAPVTIAGRLVAMFVMVVGVGIFTVMTSFFAQAFIRPHREKDEYEQLGVESKPGNVESSVEAIRKLLDQQEEAHGAAMAEMRQQLDALEDQLPKAQSED